MTVSPEHDEKEEPDDEDEDKIEEPEGGALSPEPTGHFFTKDYLSKKSQTVHL